MLNNFIYAKQKSLFEQKLNNGEVLDEAIAFIEDTKEIWNHGTYFDGSKVDLSNIEASILNILETKQDTLVSGTNIKTINGTSLLGIGDIKTIVEGETTNSDASQQLMCDINIDGNTITPVKFNGTVGSYTMPIYMAGGKPTPITSFGEANLSWGGKNYSDGYGPIDASLVNVLGANRFDGLPAECITVEYSRDDGATWLDYGATDKQKMDMVSQTADGAKLYIGKNDTDNPVNASHKLRVIINTFTQAGANRLYTELRKFIIYVSSASNFQTTCTIKKRSQSDYASGNDIWTIVSENIPITGWSGYNVINTAVIITYGIQSSYSREIMFEFSIGNPPSSGRGLSILKIFAYGGVGWTTPSNMAARGHLYSYDYQQNAKFPAKVNAVGGLLENGANLSSKYLGINAAAKSISDGTNTYTPSNIKTISDKVNEIELDLEDAIADVTSIDASLFPTSTDEIIGFRQTNDGDGIGYSEAWLDKLKGNTVVWNQRYPTGWESTNQGITSVSTDYLITLNGTTTTTYFNIKNGENTIGIPINHKGLYVCRIVKDDNDYLQGKRFALLNRSTGVTVSNKCPYFFYNNNDSTNGWGFGFAGTTSGDVITDIRIRVSIYDLTQMFGAGNEPTTIEEFNARKPLGIDEYVYNEGELISTTAEEIKSVGFNAWDEEWEVGSFDTTNGTNIEATYKIRAKNKIPILGGAKYFAKAPNADAIWAMFYDINGNVIENAEISNITNSNNVWNINYKVFTTPENARFIRFYLTNNYGNVYKNNISIHLVHTGYRNGEYEQYKEFRRSLPISEIKDSEDNALFPNGLLSAGSVYDEITATKAIKRIGVVDMGSLNIGMATATTNSGIEFHVFYANMSATIAKGSQGSISNILVKRYIANATYALPHDLGLVKSDKLIMVYTTGTIYFRDDSYADTSTIKQALQGVLLYYELAEPIEVDIEEWDRRYRVSDYGTEEIISNVATTPLKADIIYEYNAKARIDDNTDDIKELKSSLENKQDNLVSGVNIKTINGESILGEGDITIESGSEQVQPDWNETDATSPTYIANKPEIVTYYNDNNFNTTIIGNTNNLGNIQIFPDEVVLNGRVGINNVIYNDNDDVSLSFSSTGLRLREEGVMTEVLSIVNNGDGIKFLSDNGTYKEISGGNVQAVDISETLEDVETNTYISYLLQNLTEEQKELVKLNIGIKTAYELVNHGTSNTTYTLTPNVFHVWGEVTNLDLTLGLEESGILNEFLFQFSSGATATTLALPATVKWVNDNPIEIEANKTYLISILKNMASGLFYSN